MAWNPVGNLKGPQGIAGPPGSTGSQGPQGVQGPAGTTGSQGPQGVKGDKGDPGTAGTAGAAGEKWFTGAGAPAGSLLGSVVGDWYLDSTSGDYYEKTGASVWTLRGNLKGATGSQGPQGNTGSQGPQGNPGTAGTAGAPGSVWFSQAGAPASGTGIVGDYSLNTTNGDVYKKTGTSTWALQGNIKGPQGATGTTGSQGPAGADGAQGPAGQGVPTGGGAGDILRKKSSTNYDTEWKSFASLQTATTNPAITTSTVGVMMGLGAAPANAKITPTASGKVLVTITGTMFNNTASGGVFATIAYGTGTAPANGAAATGTQIGSTMQRSGPWSANQVNPFSGTALITGLTVNTQIWIDLNVGVFGASTGSVSNLTITAVELP